MTKKDFLKDIDNWCNHRYLLWEALELTKHLGLPVLELGCGDGSTPYLRQYCADENLQLYSYDYSNSYAKIHNAIYTDWSNMDEICSIRYGVTLIDESPGEHRRESLVKVLSDVVVIHDSEPIGWNSSDYKIRPLFNKFKYKFDLRSRKAGGAWATALSNTIDVSNFKL